MSAQNNDKSNYGDGISQETRRFIESMILFPNDEVKQVWIKMMESSCLSELERVKFCHRMGDLTYLNGDDSQLENIENLVNEVTDMSIARYQEQAQRQLQQKQKDMAGEALATMKTRTLEQHREPVLQWSKDGKLEDLVQDQHFEGIELDLQDVINKIIMFPSARSKKDFTTLLGDSCFSNEEKRLLCDELCEISGMNDPTDIAKLILITIQAAIANRERRYSEYYSRRHAYHIRNERDVGCSQSTEPHLSPAGPSNEAKVDTPKTKVQSNPMHDVSQPEASSAKTPGSTKKKSKKALASKVESEFANMELTTPFALRPQGETSNGKGKERNLIPETIIPSKVPVKAILEKVDRSVTDTTTTSEGDSNQHMGRKRELKQNIGREIPMEDRLPDKELLKLGSNAKPKELHAKAPYCWSKRGKLYSQYYHLALVEENGARVWPEKRVRSMLHDNKFELFNNHLMHPDVFNRKEGIRQRGLPPVKRVRGQDGFFTTASQTTEGRELENSTRVQLLYQHIGRTEKEPTVGRLRDDRKKLEARIADVAKVQAANIHMNKEVAREFNKMKAELAKELKIRDDKIAGMLKRLKDHEEIEDTLMIENKKLESYIEESTGRRVQDVIPGYETADVYHSSDDETSDDNDSDNDNDSDDENNNESHESD